jgi:hypothetical protein
MVRGVSSSLKRLAAVTDFPRLPMHPLLLGNTRKQAGSRLDGGMNSAAGATVDGAAANVPSSLHED